MCFTYLCRALPVLALCASLAPAASAKDASPDSEFIECAPAIDALPATGLMQLGATKKKRHRWRVTMDNDSPCLSFNDEFASRARLLKLPEYKGRYQIQIGSMIKPKKRSKGEHLLFSPAIQLLDENFVATREFVREDFRFRGGKISHTIFINDENAKERYILVFTTPDDLGQSESRTSGATNTFSAAGPGYFVNFTTGHDKTALIVNAPVGELRVEIKGHPDQPPTD